MDTPLTIDIGQIAHELRLPFDRVQKTVELLDDGNTVPFITRYRREQTGGFDEEVIRLIADEVKKRRQLLDRKTAILKSIEAQGKLTPELRHDIEFAPNLKRVEDLYLPYKVKKQTLAVQARERGLEPLALEILNGDPLDLEARATELVNPEKGLPTATEVLEGVQHIIAERLSERADLRGRLRRIFFRSGRLICTKIEQPPEKAESESDASETPVPAALDPAIHESTSTPVDIDQPTADAASESAPTVTSVPTDSGEQVPAEEPLAEVKGVAAPEVIAEDNAASAASEETSSTAEVPVASSEADASSATDEAPISENVGEQLPAGRMFEKPAAPILAPISEKKKKKKKKKKLADSAFKDYYNFQEPLSKLPPHRTLAINRGERANVLRVKIECDVEGMMREAETAAIPPQHPHGAFLHACLRDSLQRLMIPSLEREARREFSEKAEMHAVEVFVRNLRKLLLQPPVHGRRVLAIDPGFKSGCKMAAVDEWGNVLAHGMFFVVGRGDERKDKARHRIAEMVRQHKISVIAIGNGTGSRETEQLVAELLSTELKDQDVAYVVVNEAGASVYSTSPLGREELPGFDAILRSAVSIARRLLDPLSELVKINPANIGVGLYQHDMKAKHLKDSLDAVVESCVNFVGVDVNSASPALLRYVSGLNALTARRIYEYRREHGPFRDRETLKQVPGIGDATFVQAAGFLKILGGENPLDATWIHPESYELAQRLLERFGSSVEELKEAVPAPPVIVPEKPVVEFGAGLIPPPSETDSEAPSPSDDPIAQATVGGIQTTEAMLEAAQNSTPVDDVIARQMPNLSEQPEQAASPEPPPAATEPNADEPLMQAEAGGVQTCEAIITAALNATPADDAIAAHMPSLEVSASHEPAIAEPKHNPIEQKLAEVNISALAQEWNVSPLLVDDLVKSLTRPGRDPREELPPPVFRRGIMKLDDLAPGMELQGTVLNVVDFGAFVDIGLSDSGLVHISRLADRFIRDPHEVVGIGDVLKLWVVEIDRNRRRVSLTAIPPGMERPPRPKREERAPREQQPSNRPPRQRPPAARGDGPPPTGNRAPAGQGQGQSQGQRPSGGNRPPAGGGGPPPANRPPRGDRKPSGPPRKEQGPRVVERPSTKPKVVKPITKAQEEGKAPLRSFSDLMQLIEKKKDKKDKE